MQGTFPKSFNQIVFWPSSRKFLSTINYKLHHTINNKTASKKNWLYVILDTIIVVGHEVKFIIN